MLTYVGAVTRTPFSNGGSLLHAVTSDLLGPAGGIILGVAVLFACMTTSIGLTTSFADYFHELFPNVSYKKITAIVCCVQFCDQQHWIGYACKGFSSSFDDVLSCNGSTCNFVFL